MTGTQTILLRRIREWGNDRLYPANEAAQIVCEMVDKKTFSLGMVEQVKRLGFNVQISGWDAQ